MGIKKAYHKVFKLACDGNIKYNKPVNSYNVLSFKNEKYGTDEKNNVFDLYFSNDNKKHPTIFMVHGGGYVAGQKEDLNNFITELSFRNFNIVNFEYSKCDDENGKHMPEQIYEAFRCFEKLENDEKLSSKIDFNNFYIAGDSAGGHIAALIANIQTNKNLKEKFNLSGGPTIKGVILVSPVLGEYRFNGFWPKKPLAEIIYGEKKNNLAHFCHNLDVITRKFPPTLLFSMYNDIIAKAHVKLFCKKAKDLGFPVRFCDISKGYKLGHISPVKYANKYPLAMDEIENFIIETSHNIVPNGLEIKKYAENKPLKFQEITK